MQIIQGNSAKTILSLIFAIILCIYPLYVIAEIRTFSHEEEKDYGQTALPSVLKSRVYEDGTVVARIIRQNTNTSTAIKDCFYEMLSLRIIYLNGTVDEKDIKIDIQQFNYCFFQDETKVAGFLDYQLIRKNHILITYYNATDLNDFYTYEEWGMVIDFDGKELDRISFGLAFIDEVTHQFVPSKISKVQLNINREKGFIRLANSRSSNETEWQQYRIEPDGTFTKLTNGKVENSLVDATVSTVATVDEGYAIIYANTTNNSISTDLNISQSRLFVLLIGYDQTTVPPLLIYQTPLPNLNFNAITCDISFIGAGQICILTISQKDPDGLTPDKIFYAKINFLSSGSVTSFTFINSFADINGIIPDISNNNLNIVWVVNGLPFGGYLLTYTINNGDNNAIYGYLFDENDTNYIQWEFPEPEPTNIYGIFQILPHNNTLLVAQKETNNSWQFQIIDLPKFVEDKGYSNLNVKETFPAINSSINSNILKVSIDFYKPVELSSGKLSIYQVIDDQQYLRQSTPGVSCSIENDSKTVSAVVLDSTFSVSKGNCFIKVDNDFVRDKEYREPLLGIRENIWSFTTEEKKDIFSPSATALLRLTTNGTQLFDNLSQDEHNNFFDTLLEELSVAVPVVLSRLTTNRKTQLDKSVNGRQYLISIVVKETDDKYDNSVTSIINFIDTMVKHKDQTPIGLGRATVHLDESYGFVRSPEKRFLILLAVGIFIVIFFILFLFAKRKDNNGDNIVILQLGIIIFDLFMDILFMKSNAKDISILYIPSIIFITVPIGINLILVSYIIKQEITRPKFHQWFTARGKIASIFIVLSGADIKVLNVLHSNLAGVPFFRAPFSDSAKSKVFWDACLNIFIRDIPQAIIQIFYRYKINPMYYNTISILMLISSVINLTINVLIILYKAKSHVRNRNKSDQGTSNSTLNS